MKNMNRGERNLARYYEILNSPVTLSRAAPASLKNVYAKGVSLCFRISDITSKLLRRLRQIPISLCPLSAILKCI